MSKIAAAEALLNLLAASHILDKSARGTPSAISNSISKLVAHTADDPKFEKPSPVNAILADLLADLKTAKDELTSEVTVFLDSIQAIVDPSASAKFASAPPKSNDSQPAKTQTTEVTKNLGLSN